MTEPVDQRVPAEPHEGIDPFHNKESEKYEENQSSPLARGAAGGAPEVDAPRQGEEPAGSGTGSGNALAGVTMTAEDSADTVPGDEGPEHPGTRRSH